MEALRALGGDQRLRPLPAGAAAAMAGVLVAPGLPLLAGEGARGRAAIRGEQLSLPPERPAWLTPDMVLTFLGYSLDPTSEKTATSLALMLATFLLLFVLVRLPAAVEGVGLAAGACWWRRTCCSSPWTSTPPSPISSWPPPTAPPSWLMAHNAGRHAAGVHRPGGPEDRGEQAAALPGYPEVTGYSSLQTTRHQEYMVKTIEVDKPLLDLYNVRFVVMPKRFPALPSFEYTAYHPTRPLAEGPAATGGPTYLLPGPARESR